MALKKALMLGTAALILLTALPMTHAQTPLPPSPAWSRAMPLGPDARIKITEEYARHVARDAYFWTWPMVNIYNRRLAFAQAPSVGLLGGLPFAPLNRLSMLHAPSGAPLVHLSAVASSQLRTGLG